MCPYESKHRVSPSVGASLFWREWSVNVGQPLVNRDLPKAALDRVSETSSKQPLSLPLVEAPFASRGRQRSLASSVPYGTDCSIAHLPRSYPFSRLPHSIEVDRRRRNAREGAGPVGRELRGGGCFSGGGGLCLGLNLLPLIVTGAASAFFSFVVLFAHMTLYFASSIRFRSGEI